MIWEKLGKVYVASGKQRWDRTHAYIPTPIILEDRVRVYVAFWDASKVGRIGYVDLDKDDITKVVNVSKQPVLDIGRAGTFDDSGVSPVSIVELDNMLLLYYIGWQKGVKVRYYLFSGLAISTDGGESFIRNSEVPILDRSKNELFLRSAPFVMRDKSGYKMWYVSGTEWITLKGKEVPTYSLRYMRSYDPFEWRGDNIECMKLNDDDEYGFGRPWVIKEKGLYKMWYSIRLKSKGYRIGYAESIDGLDWERKDNVVGIDVSETGWDSEMICFSAIVDIGDERFMLYNGNNFGESGFGVAKLKHGSC